MRIGVIAVTVLLTASAAYGQTDSAVSAEVITGWAGFVDDGTVGHTVIGGSVRLQLGRRISVGPELVSMRGPGHQDIFITGNLTFDVRSQTPGNPPRVGPFLVIGFGGMHNTERTGTGDFSSWEGAFTGGGGVRVMLTPTLFALAEARVGWEPHLRFTGGVGFLTR